MNGISIPIPCNEDFSKMSPTERGSFCQNCSIDVYDFSYRSLTEIRSILAKSNGQHMCGRFTEAQLNTLNHDFRVWERNHVKTFQSKFVFALLLAFGLSLFSCTEESSSNVNELQQARASLLADPESAIDQLGLLVSNHHANVVFDHVEEFREIELEQSVVMGQLVQVAEESIKVSEGIHWAGGIHYTESYIEYLEIAGIADDSTESLLPEPILNETSFTTKAFPNPTEGPFTLQIHIAKTARFTARLFSLSGELIQVIHDGELIEGEQRIEVDLGGMARGTYLLSVLSEDQQETVKVQKL